MKTNTFNLTLDIRATYKIKVPGIVKRINLGFEVARIEYKENENNSQVVSILICQLDQAGLYGLLRQLYTMGLPLISVSCLECIGEKELENCL